MSEKRKYDSTVARIAGNILSGRQPKNHGSHLDDNHLSPDDVRAVWFAVALARAIVAEVERTEKRENVNENDPSPQAGHSR